MTSKMITKLYYDVVSILLFYESTDSIERIKKEVLSLLCAVYEAQELQEECRQEIKSAELIRVCSDGLLLENANKHSPNVDIDMKMEILTANKISTQKQFDFDLFSERIEEAAFVGQKSACQLLAFLHWIGIGGFQDKNKAESIFKELALTGDGLSLNALIYVYSKTDNEEQKRMWTKIRDAINDAIEKYVPVVKKTDEITEEEFWLSNIIMIMKWQKTGMDNRGTDRSVLYYLMNSKDDYSKKIKRLCGDKTFHPIILNHEMYGNKQYGF